MSKYWRKMLISAEFPWWNEIKSVTLYSKKLVVLPCYI